MTVEWLLFLAYIAGATLVIVAAAGYALYLTRLSGAEHVLETAERVR